MMRRPAKRDPRLQYLHKRGQVWWLKLAIPREVRPLFLSANGIPKTHMEETLNTSDLDRAHALKFDRIAHWQREFRRKQRKAGGTLAPDIAEAHCFRDAIHDAANDEEIDILQSIAVERAEQLEATSGDYTQAKAWYDLATDVQRPTLRRGFEEWIGASNRAAGTTIQYRHAFNELLGFLKVGGDTMPDYITQERATQYLRWLDTEAKGPHGPLAFDTKEVRRIALSSFWTKYLQRNHYVPHGSNPWRGYTFAGKKERHKDGAEMVRAHTDEELLSILNGPDLKGTYKVHYPKRTLIELYALGEYTGCRLNELCSLTLGDVQKMKHGYTIHVRKAKSAAGVRSLPVVHAVPVAVLKRRIGQRTDSKAQLFEEFRIGGIGKLSANVQKALGRYRKSIGLPSTVDYHSTRRDFLTMLEGAGANPIWTARYVGHQLPGVTFGVYTQGQAGSLLQIAETVKYSNRIERGFRNTLGIK
jgi:integrase